MSSLTLRRKTLLPVILSYPTPKSTTPSCPSCTKELSNSTNAILLASRKPAVPPATAEGDDEPPAKKKKKGKKDEAPYVCGHVVCKNCSDTIVKPAGRCCVCEAEVDDAGRIPLGKEGECHAVRLVVFETDKQELGSPLRVDPRSSLTA